MTRALRFAAATAVLLSVGMGTTANAAPRAARTIDVTIQNFAYSPNPITIDPGDTIRWTNLDTASHSAVTVQTGFVTQVLSQGQSTTTLFERAGTYEYVCAVHGASMRGTVIVRGTPTETIAAPAGPAGRVVDDRFVDARPDVFAQAASGGTVLLYGALLLVLAALARFVWVVRHW